MIQVLLIIVVLIAIGVFIRMGYTSSWTGLEGKTLWDWMELLIVPVVLAVGAYLFNRAERRADRLREEERAEVEFKLAFENAQEARLQNYLDQMTNLILDKNLLNSKPGDEIRDIARAHTISVLNVLDGTRKATVLEFLHKSKLISGEAVISLRQASLNGLDLLFGTDLRGANLEKAFLNNANLVSANLREANLSSAYLRGTRLNGADLTGADLTDVILSEATMAEALLLSGSGNISMAELRNAVLDDPELSASDLDEMVDGATLRGAIIANDQLATARSMKGTTMPDGKRYNGGFNLPGDILAANRQGVDTDDAEAMERWYAGQ